MPNHRIRAGLLGAFVLLGGASVHGYASTNSIKPQERRSEAGFGAQVVQKLKVTDVDVTYNATNKNQASAIVFTVVPRVYSPANDTRVFMKVTPTATWTSCGTIANNATTVTCPYTGPVNTIGKNAANMDGGLRLVTAD